MKRIIILMIMMAMPASVRAECACANAPAIAAWAATGWTLGFVVPFGIYSTAVKVALDSHGATEGSAGESRRAAIQEMSKGEAQAKMQSEFMKDDVNRKAKAEMANMNLLMKQDTLTQKAGGSNSCDGSTISGNNGVAFAEGRNNALVMESVVASEMNRDSREEIRQGTDVIDYRRKLLKAYPSAGARSVLPENGRLTYTQKEMEAATHMIALSANVDGRLPSDKIGLEGKDKEVYDSLVAQRQYASSLGRMAVADVLMEKAPLVDSVPLQALAAAGGSTNGSGDVYKTQGRKLSREAQRRIWAEYHMSPGVSNDIGIESAPSYVYEVMAKNYASMLEGLVAMKRLAAILAMGNGDQQRVIDARLDALSVPKSK